MQIAAASPGYQALLVLVEDAFFMVLATLFLMTGERFGNQRHPQAVSYPGEQALLLHSEDSHCMKRDLVLVFGLVMTLPLTNAEAVIVLPAW